MPELAICTACPRLACCQKLLPGMCQLQRPHYVAMPKAVHLVACDGIPDAGGEVCRGSGRDCGSVVEDTFPDCALQATCNQLLLVTTQRLQARQEPALCPWKVPIQSPVSPFLSIGRASLLALVRNTPSGVTGLQHAAV